MKLRYSSLYLGRLVHLRRSPKRHRLQVPLYMLYLDLDELEQVDSTLLLNVDGPGLLSFHRSDYFGDPEKPLKQSLLEAVSRELGISNISSIRVLTQVRVLGYVFNPVSFYFCFSEDEQLLAVVSEITNTPWNERHAYYLRAQGNRVALSFHKNFHVSPFFPMEQCYDWYFSSPGEGLKVIMKNYQEGKLVFSAHLSLTRNILAPRNIFKTFFQYPLMSIWIHFLIYLHALLLKLKGVPFFAHPRSLGERQNG